LGNFNGVLGEIFRYHEVRENE